MFAGKATFFVRCDVSASAHTFCLRCIGGNLIFAVHIQKRVGFDIENEFIVIRFYFFLFVNEMLLL